MSNVLVEEQNLYDIADAIRAKNGSNQSYYPSEMAQAIEDIPTGGETQTNCLCFTAEQANSTVYIQCHKDLNINLQYSYDNSTWNDWTSSLSGSNDVFSTITLTNIGDKVYIRGNNATMGISTTVYSKFIMSGRIAASGNIQSLLTYDCSYKGVQPYCYYSMFHSCTSLTTAPELQATTLAIYCYCYMFQSCTSLTTAPPVLPATTLSQYCYYSMFHSCTSLTTAPELHATTLAQYCYQNMFYNCSYLNKITVYATSWNITYANNWVSGVSSTGTFTKPSGASIATGASGIPSGWTVVNI